MPQFSGQGNSTLLCNTSEAEHREPLPVAIVGGGLTGLATTVGLVARGVRVRLYERTARFDPTGNGIGITPHAERAMKAVGPRIHKAFKKRASPTRWKRSQYVDGEYPSDDAITATSISSGAWWASTRFSKPRARKPHRRA